MPDFGFDAYALDDLDSTGVPPSLKVARDLIAAGKPRSALEILAEHHQHLADDPDYLMLCGEAWLAAGHGPRAQHAFLGAIRVAPKDPRPLRLLADLLVERGEKARARRVFQKAKRLELAETTRAPGAVEEVDMPNDLIAAAEREERIRQTPFNPHRFLLVLAVVVAVGLLTSTIALIPGPAPDLAKDSLTVTAIVDPATDAEVAPQLEKPLPAERAAVEVVPEPTAVTGEAPSAIPTVLEPVIEAPKPEAAAAPRAKKRSRPSASPKTRDDSPPVPTAADLVAELAASTDAAALTRRADAVSARQEPTSAAQFYRRALEIDPDYAPALVGIGRSLLRAEKYAEAMRNASRALQLARGVDARPGLEAEALYQIGRVHHQRGEEDAARQLLRQSISLRRTPAEAWFYLGESLSQDNSPAARDAYEQYLERKPNGHLADRARRAIQ